MMLDLRTAYIAKIASVQEYVPQAEYITFVGYLAYTHFSAPVVSAQESAVQTATVQQGDLTITADGTGNLLPAVEAAVAFQSGGVLSQVNVQAGDKVKAGDVLAQLDDT